MRTQQEHLQGKYSHVLRTEVVVFCMLIEAAHLLMTQPTCMCRSVQTAFSVAESIGYCTDFVLLSDEEQQPIGAALSEGMTMAALLCWTTVIVLVVAGSCYVIQNMVA